MKSPHPLDAALEGASDERRQLIRLFAADGVICETERAALRLIDRLRSGVLVYRQRQQAAESFERNGTSDHTHRLIRDCGLRLVPKEEGRMVAFPTNDEPLDAA